MKTRMSIFLIALSLAACLALQIPTHVRAQGVELGDGVVITAEVVAIDRVDRTLVLLGPEGNVVAVEVGHEARNFDQIEVGDQVKSFVFDRERVFIGSFNLDSQSRIQNTEIGVVFESADIASRMAEGFDQKIDQAAFRLELKTYENGSEQILWHGLVDGEQRVLKVDPYTGFWKRFGIDFMKLLPIESLL